MTGIIWSQEPTEVVIDDYPLGVGGSVGDDFYKPYYFDLRSTANFLNENPNAKGIITGGADRYQYAKNNDAKNPGLALGRANDLKRYMIEKFGVDSTQLVVQSDEPIGKGGEYRYSCIRIETPSEIPVPTPTVDTTYLEPKIVSKEYHHWADNIGLNIRTGVSSSPYGLMPIVSGAVVYQHKLHIEGQFGHTLWDNNRDFDNMSLDVWYRMAGGQLIYYPFDQTNLGLIAGWFRVEEISQEFYGYTRMSEGPTLGVRWHFLDFLNLSGSYFPHKERIAEELLASTRDNSFMISLTLNKYFGGDQ